MVGWVGDGADVITPHLFADADLGGCTQTQRSTSGAHLVMRGPNTSFPIAFSSKRIGCVVLSTAEAELYAGFYALKTHGLPALDFWETVLQRQLVLQFHEDNQAMIRVMKTGRNFQMRYATRTLRLPIAWLHERFNAGDIHLKYELSSRMAADVYTKAFADADKWRVATWLINVADPRVFDEAAAFAMQESDEQALPDEPQEEDTNATVAAAVANAASFKIKNLSARFRATLAAAARMVSERWLRSNRDERSRAQAGGQPLAVDSSTSSCDVSRAGYVPPTHSTDSGGGVWRWAFLGESQDDSVTLPGGVHSSGGDDARATHDLLAKEELIPAGSLGPQDGSAYELEGQNPNLNIALEDDLARIELTNRIRIVIKARDRMNQTIARYECSRRIRVTGFRPRRAHDHDPAQTLV